MTKAPENLLVRGVNWLGDAVMTTPALLRLRGAFPEAKITLLTPEKLRELWTGHPAFDAVLTFTPQESVWQVGRRLRAGGFTTALVLPNSPRSALEPWWAGIPERVGYARSWRNWFLTRRVAPRPEAVAMRKRPAAEIRRLTAGPPPAPPRPPPPAAHHLHQYLHLAAALGANPAPLAPRIAVADSAVEQFVDRFGLRAADGTLPTYFALNAGAAYGPAKCWPLERFHAAAREIQARTRGRWLIFGVDQPGDPGPRLATELAASAATGLGPPPPGTPPWVVNLVGRSGLGDLCAGLRLSRVLLANDSGPMHLAAAVGTAVVATFGGTSPELTGPGLPGDPRVLCLRSPQPVPCSPCFLRVCPIDFRCMTGISVEQAVAAVLALA